MGNSNQNAISSSTSKKMMDHNLSLPTLEHLTQGDDNYTVNVDDAGNDSMDRKQCSDGVVKKFKCTSCCLMEFETEEALNTHLMLQKSIEIQSHDPSKPWQCPSCHQSFERKSDLKRHIRGHTGDRPYRCRFCVKRYIQS